MSTEPSLYTETDRAFVRGIINAPGDAAPRLVYADWLDERGEELTERAALFLRRSVALAAEPVGTRARSAIRAELTRLVEHLPADWVAVLDLAPVENCASAFKFRCPLRWDHLHTREDPAVRHCAVCDRPVHYCETVDEAADHAFRGECVAIGTAALRYRNDLASEVALLEGLLGPRSDAPMYMGAFDPGYARRANRRPWWKFW